MMAWQKKWLAVLSFCTPFLLPAQAQAGDISLQQIDGVDYITIEGDVEPSDLAHFQRLAVSSETAVVVLGSPGGALAPALEIGKIIRLKGFATFVPGGVECTSACALIWIAGQPRMLSPTSRIGFHASYVIEDGRQSETGQGNAMVGRYLTLLNLPERAVMFATRAGPNQIEWVNPRDPLSSGIDFKLIEDDDEDDPPSAASVIEEEAPIIARADFSWRSGVWTVLSTKDRAGCFALAEFTTQDGEQNFSAIRLSKNRHQSFATLSFENDLFKSIKPGESYRLQIVFQTGNELDDGWGEKEFFGVVYSSDLKGLVAGLDWKEIANDIKTEEYIAFFLGDNMVDVFPLEGSARAMQELDKCLGSARTARLTDPFE